MATQQKLFCSQCGTSVAEDDKFCRSCGEATGGQPVAKNGECEVGSYPVSADAATIITPAPAPTVVMPAVTPAVAAAAKSVPGWLIPAGVGAVVLVGVVVAFVLFSLSDSGPDPLSAQAAPILAPVNSDISDLSSSIGSAETSSALKSTVPIANRLKSDAEQAQVQVAALKLRSSDETAAAQLSKALNDTSDFADKLAAAARDPRAGTVGPVRSAASSTAAAYAALAASNPGMMVPRNSQFSVNAVVDISNQKQKAASSAAAAHATEQAYVSQIDSLLRNSADTRKNLGDLITEVQNGSISPAEARSWIASIINQRQDLQNASSAVPAPGRFAYSSELLRESLTSALADDVAIQGWLDAWLEQDVYAYDNYWQKHLTATADASREKAAFVAAYNAARAKALRLGPLSVGDQY